MFVVCIFLFFFKIQCEFSVYFMEFSICFFFLMDFSVYFICNLGCKESSNLPKFMWNVFKCTAFSATQGREKELFCFLHGVYKSNRIWKAGM